MEKIKFFLIAAGIAVLLPMFIGYAVDTFYPEPDYNDFCEGMPRPVKIGENMTEESCVSAGGEWSQNYCDFYSRCSKEYEGAMEKYGDKAFIIIVILGIIALIAGNMLKKASAGSGFMAGGIITVVYGSSAYWRYAPKYLRLALLAFALGVLVYIAYKKSKK